ncbi:MAG: hypothetical protein GY744_01065 [Gammaproteobacteria bacterium]|nr:hypothetical protein [Gammaproteobacteria bacterium]
MELSEDTITQINKDLNEDKMLILTGKQRLKYFPDTRTPIAKPLSEKKSGLIRFIRKLIR